RESGSQRFSRSSGRVRNAGRSLRPDLAKVATNRKLKRAGASLICARDWLVLVALALRVVSRGQEPLFTYAWDGRQGSLRRLGQGGSPVGTLTPATIGRVRLACMPGPNAIDTSAVVPSGFAWLNDHTGCVPFGAEIVTLMREPAR